MSWKSRVATIRRVGIMQVALARAWIFLRADERVRSRYRVDPGDLVVDVGAYEGEFAADMRDVWDAEVFAVEPIPEFAGALKERFAGDSHVTVMPFALGGADGFIRISMAADGSSAWVESRDAVEVPLRDVASVLGAREVSLFKINAEGAEFDVLDRLLETGKVRQIRCLQIQFHRFVPGADARRKAIRRRLEATHRCSWSVPWVWEQWVRRS
jgi:FkbM family methyltransferase